MLQMIANAATEVSATPHGSTFKRVGMTWGFSWLAHAIEAAIGQPFNGYFNGIRNRVGHAVRHAKNRIACCFLALRECRFLKWKHSTSLN
jgi:hypothetical protein